jgi:hypothetical protein
MKTHITVIGIILFLTTHSVRAQERKIEYEEFNQVLDIAQNRVNSDYFVCVFKVKIKNTALNYDDISIWLTQNGKEISRAKIDDKGNITLPILNPDKAEKTTLHLNQLEQDASISLYTDVAPITTKKVMYRDLFVLLEDMNHFTDVMAGGMSWLIPSLDEIEFRFERSATILFNTENGDKQEFGTDKENKITIPLKKAWMKMNPELEFSDLPTRYEPKL